MKGTDQIALHAKNWVTVEAESCQYVCTGQDSDSSHASFYVWAPRRKGKKCENGDLKIAHTTTHTKTEAWDGTESGHPIYE